MSDWSEGYVSDIGYTFGYYQELSPARIPFALLNHRLAQGETATACELGFGQGVSTTMHAAASNVQWYGTDFNPAHAAFARELAEVSGSGAKLYDDAFADFCRRDDLPDFDFIALHGIWSWISDENRNVIVDFIRRKLKVGGVVYISYNTLPGWAPLVPMRHLLNEYVDHMAAGGAGIVPKIDAAVGFFEQMMATEPGYSRANPMVADRFAKLKEGNRHYLAHEYFNRDWHPMHFRTLANWLKPAKLDFACSAHFIDFIPSANLPKGQIEFLKGITDPYFRESIRDFMVNQQFRRDYWIKGARSISPLEQVDGLRRQRFVMSGLPRRFDMKIRGAIGEATLSEAVYRPVIDLLSDYRSRTLGELEQALCPGSISFAQLIEVVTVLSGAGLIVAAQDDATVRSVKPKTDRLNRRLMERARGDGGVDVLASPVTGGAVSVDRFSQLFLRASLAGHSAPRALAQVVWGDVALQGLRLSKSGKTLETAEENIAELAVQAQAFLDEQLPRLAALGLT